ncbi:hypothetical protein, partial [Candidatus Entotheonella palauensis]|uniref:hypothetical protein n=1 Tax=Candidatus Entotheonella palauensis TaxID=93172 RepID=UPI0015C4886B
PQRSLKNKILKKFSGYYVTLDIRLAWQPLESLELALVGQNLLERRHGEFRQEIFPFQTEVERGVYGTLSWRF